MQRGSIGYGYRRHLSLALSAALIPAMLITLAWAWSENIEIQGAQRDRAGQAATITADRIDASLRVAYLYGAMIAADFKKQPLSRNSCSLLGELPANFGVTLIAHDQMLCRRGAATEFSAGRNRSPVPITLGDTSATLSDGGVRIALDHDQGFLVMAWPQDLLQDMREPQAQGITITDAQDRTVVAPQNYGNPAVLADRCLARNGDIIGDPDSLPSAACFVRPIGMTSLFLKLAYPTSRFGALLTWPWLLVLEMLAMAASIIVAGVWIIDRTIGSWINYLRRIVTIHSKGRLSVSVLRLQSAAREIAELGTAINGMTDNIASRAENLKLAIADRDKLFQELQHRVRGNFEIIGSLLSLYKNVVGPERQKPINFIENHVRSMALIYRSNTKNYYAHMSLFDVARDVVTILGANAGLADDFLRISVETDQPSINIDQATALSLCLTYSLPHYLEAQANNVVPGKAWLQAGLEEIMLEFEHLPTPHSMGPTFQGRLVNLYARQINAELILPEVSGGLYRLRVPLMPGQSKA